MTADDRISIWARMLMGRHALSQQQVAAALGVTQQAVSARLGGKTHWLAADIRTLAELFEVDPGMLFSPPDELFSRSRDRGSAALACMRGDLAEAA